MAEFFEQELPGGVLRKTRKDVEGVEVTPPVAKADKPNDPRPDENITEEEDSNG